MLTWRSGFAAAALALFSVGQVQAASDQAIAEIREHWAACSALLENDADTWIGWKRDFGNGYADDFQFYDRRFEGSSVSVLRQLKFIDAIVSLETISCFRPDGSLAFIYTVMNSPNIAEGEQFGIAREGRIYFDEGGQVIRTLGRITDFEGKEVAGLDDPDYQLARGCNDAPLDVHLSADDVEREYLSVLGDIEGNRPAYEPNFLDWCAGVTGN